MSYTQRNADYVITKAFLIAQRKATPPTSGTTKYNALLGIVDTKQQEWANEPGIEWDSLYGLVTNNTITATDTFDLDDSINYISKREGDYLTLVSGTQTQIVKLVAPDQLYSYNTDVAAAQIGRTIKFSKAFTSTDKFLGYSLKIPAMQFPDDITSGSTLVQVDDPMWLAYATAAEFVRNDPVRVSQYENILDMAELSMQKMKQANSGQIEEIPRSAFVTGQTWV